jgi:hypothetical protein
MWLWPLIIFVVLTSTYSIKLLVIIWNPRLREYVSDEYLIVGLIVFAIIWALSAAASSIGGAPARHTWKIIIPVGVAIYIAFEAVYALWVYPRLWPGLGGGLPRDVTLWLKQEDHASDIASVLNTRITPAGSSQRVDGLYVLLDREGDLLLTDTAIGPGRAILVRKDRLMAISW